MSRVARTRNAGWALLASAPYTPSPALVAAASVGNIPIVARPEAAPEEWEALQRAAVELGAAHRAYDDAYAAFLTAVARHGAVQEPGEAGEPS